MIASVKATGVLAVDAFECIVAEYDCENPRTHIMVELPEAGTWDIEGPQSRLWQGRAGRKQRFKAADPIKVVARPRNNRSKVTGIGLRPPRLPSMANQLSRWKKVPLAMIAYTAIPIFLADPTRYANSGPFRLKMILLSVALTYQFTVSRMVTGNDLGSRDQSLSR